MPHQPDASRRIPVVAGFGAVSIDDIMYVAETFDAGKGRVLQREYTYGGNISTALAAVVSLGGEARYLGFLPDPVEWSAVYDDLTSHGIDHTRATQAHGHPPIRSAIIVPPDGDRFIAFDDNTPVGIDPDRDLSEVTSADAVLVDSYAATAGLPAILAARAAGVPVIGDLERVGLPGTEELHQAVSHLVVPMTYALTVTAITEPEAAIDALWNDDRQAIVITDGHHGSWYSDRADRVVHHQPAFAVKVVDTNGAGDVFHGAYSLAIASGMTVGEAVRRSSAAAAVSATGVGGRGRLPTDASVSALLLAADSS